MLFFPAHKSGRTEMQEKQIENEKPALTPNAGLSFHQNKQKSLLKHQIILKCLKASIMLIPVLYPVVVLSLDTHVEIHL